MKQDIKDRIRRLQEERVFMEISAGRVGDRRNNWTVVIGRGDQQRWVLTAD